MNIPNNDVEIDSFLEKCQIGRIPMKGWIHPLGFVHVKVLIDGNDTEKVRFRFWKNKMDVSSVGVSDRVHNHAFDFTSFILCGKLLEKRYNTIFDPVGSHRIWEVESPGGRSLLRKTTIKCNLSESKGIHHSSRSLYKMKVGIFHDVIAICDYTATLVFETPRAEIASLVICSKDVEKITNNAWPEVSQEQIRTFIEQVIQRRRK